MVTALVNSLSVESSKKDVFLSVLQVLAATLFLTLCSQLRVPLYFSPVPLSGQTFGVMFIGATLGSRKGFLSVLAYLTEGALGLPVFTGGHSGLVSLLGPTGGYFLGFLAQVSLIGWFAERQKAFQIAKTLPILLTSCLIQLGLGVMWLSFWVPLESVLIMGLYPFLAGEGLKSIVLAVYLNARAKCS